MNTADSTHVMVQPTKATDHESERYTPASADLPRVLHYSYRSIFPFLPQQEPEPTSNDWTKFIHPNGTPYWYNSGRSTILANYAYDLTNEDQSLRLVNAINAIWADVRPDMSAPMSSTTAGDQNVMADYELFIDIDHKSPESTVRYYFVDWAGRTIFWLQTQPRFGAVSEEHFAVQLQAEFWTHVAAYPMHHPLPPGSNEELCSIIGYDMIESLQSSVTVLWSTQDMQFILLSLKQGSGHSMGSKPQHLAEETRISNATIARLWREICQFRVTNFYGDPRAKRSGERRSTRGHHAIARTIFSLILFNRPRSFEADLEDIFFEDMLYPAQWREYVEKEIEPEWQGIQSAIMLAANMAFLALDSVQQANDGPFLACKTLSLSSTTFSVAALFATLKLARIHQRWRSASIAEASKHMFECSRRTLGLFGMAMVYSIPFTLFMWSLITFVAAVLLYTFQHWTRDTGFPLIVATVAPIVALIGWEWWFFRAGSKSPQPAPSVAPTVSKSKTTGTSPGSEPKRTPSSGLHIPLQLLSLSNLRGRSRSDDAENDVGSR